MDVFSQSISLNPRSQSVCWFWSQSQSGSGGSNWVAPVTATQTSPLAVEALVRLSAMTPARQLCLYCIVLYTYRIRIQELSGSGSVFRIRIRIRKYRLKTKKEAEYVRLERLNWHKMSLAVLWIRIRIGSEFRSFLDPDPELNWAKILDPDPNSQLQ